MAQKYKLVMKKNLGKDADLVPGKHYAILKYNGFKLCRRLICRLSSPRKQALLQVYLPPVFTKKTGLVAGIFAVCFS